MYCRAITEVFVSQGHKLFSCLCFLSQVFPHSTELRDSKAERRSVEQALRGFNYVKALQISLRGSNRHAARFLATLGELIR